MIMTIARGAWAPLRLWPLAQTTSPPAASWSIFSRQVPRKSSEIITIQTTLFCWAQSTETQALRPEKQRARTRLPATLRAITTLRFTCSWTRQSPTTRYQSSRAENSKTRTMTTPTSLISLWSNSDDSTSFWSLFKDLAQTLYRLR